MQKIMQDLPHILVVDDDKRIARLVCRYLSDHDYMALRAENADEARLALEDMEFDALVVDVMMPGESGLEFVQDLRKRNVNVPVLLLTALGEIEDRVAGFEVGADDYLSKPFEPKELLLRLNAILRRTQKKKAATRFKIGRWVFDEALQSLDDGAQQVRLTTMEMNLLRALARTPGIAVSREELASVCELDAGERTIDVQVTRLRRKLEEDTKNPRHLQTIRGKGYLLRVDGL